MAFLNNKFFISFLILMVAVLGISTKTAEAKGVASVFTKVLIAVVVVAAIIVTSGGALGLASLVTPALIVGGAALGITTISQIVCVVGSDNVGFTGCGGDNGGGAGGGGGGASVSSGNKPLNCWQITSTMYIPQLNGSGYNNQCAQPLNETQSQIAIYRYSIPNSSSQSTLNDWYLNQIKTKVGNGYLVNGYHTAATEEGKIAQLPYSQLCAGNVCKFTDDTVPDNSYVAYGAKIIGNYYKNEGGSCSWPNKFLNKDNAGSVTMSDTYKLGNAFDGPYNIAACPPKVDLKINTYNDYSEAGQYVVWYPRTDAELKWTTQKVKDCVAESTDNLWTGNQAVSGTKDLGKLSRGTINPGQGKTYYFTLSCKSILDNSILKDTVAMTVKRAPLCSFSADPSIIAT